MALASGSPFGIQPTQMGTPPQRPTAESKYGTLPTDPYLPVAELRKMYENYLYTKTWEIQEKRVSRRYYAGDQWTADELKKLKLRNQPKVTRNRVKRKLNGIVGLVERLRQDPKCYPRTPKHDADADLATAVIRYVLDASRWETLSSKVAADAAREGIGCLELGLKATAQGDHDITLTHVTTDTFFYDPRSYRYDFGDCLFEGTAKWVDVEIAKEFTPEDKWSDLESVSSTDSGAVYSEDGERAVRWMDSVRKRLRLVDIWYYRNGQWCWALFSYGTILMEGVSPFVDIEGKTISKFLAFAANVDPDGDRYGFVRDMKDIQDEINHRYSKGLHLLNTRRTFVRRGTMDVNKMRQELLKADGIIEWDAEKPEFDDQRSLSDMAGQIKFLEDAKGEIENFGPNPALIGQGVENKSGRAIALLQQAGIAELGPYIIEFKDWKLRVYRAVFANARKHWTMQRWIRVTDPDDEQQLIVINGLRYQPPASYPSPLGMPGMSGMMQPAAPPMPGMPAPGLSPGMPPPMPPGIAIGNEMGGGSFQTVNAISQVDVDIIIDEGADTINMMQDTFDTLGLLASRGANVPPQLLIELAPIPQRIKKKWLERMDQAAQPDPQKQQLKDITVAGEAAKVAKTKSETDKNIADAMSKVVQAFTPATMPMEPHVLGLADVLAGSPGAQGPAGVPGPGGGGPPPPPEAAPGMGAPPPGGAPPPPAPPGSLGGSIDMLSGLAGPKPPLGAGNIG